MFGRKDYYSIINLAILNYMARIRHEAKRPSFVLNCTCSHICIQDYISSP